MMPFLEAVLIGPLPVIFELGHILGLIVGGIQIGHARRQTGIHDRQILIGQRQIDHQLGTDLLDQRRQSRHILGIDGIGRNLDAGALLHRFGDGIALALGAAGQMDVGENPGVHRHLVDRHAADAAGANHQNLAQNLSPCSRLHRATGHSNAKRASKTDGAI
jgi:hypothetical protein